MIFHKLEQNISTAIYEGLLKIGYSGNEDFSMYYDLDLLNYLLDTKYEKNEDCLSLLSSFIEVMKEKKIPCVISLEKNRFKFTVQKEGVHTIYKLYDNPFLKELIDLVKSHVFNLDDVLEIFNHSGHAYICEPSKNEEFQFVIYFKDDFIDPYRYCFSFDGIGGYYHRLLEYDYNKVI